ncbi:MAG: hypothetical protein ABJN42_07675, partial [Roseibium sp.]|uniref:hypothetical protein n=1 Tax=Roseibium sp. TaxID=1936156 RepID=UPI00329A36F5
MPETALFGLTKLVTAAVSAVMTGPIGGPDIPDGDFNAIIAHRSPGYQATVSWPDGSTADHYRA